RNDRRDWFERTIDLLRARYRTVRDFAELGRPYFSSEYVYEEIASRKNLKDSRLPELMRGLADRLARVHPFTHETAETALREYSEEVQVKPGLLINAARTGLTGQHVGPGMFDIMMILGQDQTVDRLVRTAGQIEEGSLRV